MISLDNFYDFSYKKNYLFLNVVFSYLKQFEIWSIT